MKNILYSETPSHIERQKAKNCGIEKICLQFCFWGKHHNLGKQEYKLLIILIKEEV